MDRLSVLCFAGTYALALASELSRLALRRGGSWLLSVSLIALGLLVHSAFLVNRAVESYALPITTYFESMLVLGLVLAAISLYLVAHGSRERPTIAGLLVLMLVLVVLAVAGWWAPRPGTRADWSNILTFWGTVHGLFQILGASFTCLAFVFGLMYLAQSHRLKRKQSAGGSLALPSLEQSERWHRAAITIAFPLMTAGLLTGVGLILATQRSGSGALRWSDLKVISTLALWLVFAALLHARFRPEWRGRRVMFLTIVAFAFLAFAMVGVGLIFPTQHGGLAGLESAQSHVSQSDGRAP